MVVTARIDFACAHLHDSEAEFCQNTRGRRVVVQSCRVDFQSAEAPCGKLDEESSHLGAEALAPERRENRVPNGRYIGWLGMPSDAAQGDEIPTRLKRGTETVVATGRRRCLAELACLLHRDWPSDPEKSSCHLPVRVQRFHELGIIPVERAKHEPLRLQHDRWSHPVSAERPVSAVARSAGRWILWFGASGGPVVRQCESGSDVPRR
jgi:hypothetical protein